MADDADKTQAPTVRRRQQAREAGQVAHSQDLSSALLLLGCFTLVVTTGGALVAFLMELLQSSLGGSAWRAGLESNATRETFLAQWHMLVASLGERLLPVLAGATLLALGVHWLQTGFIFLPARAMPDFSRVNPAKGFGRMWSGENFSRLLFGLFKVVVVAAVGLAGAWSRRNEIAALAGVDLPELASDAWEICLWSCVEMGGALLALSALDYLYQRASLERSLQMTPQEVREEMRELQGDPQIAARRRQIARRTGGQQDSGAKGETHPTDRRAIATSPAQIGAVDSIR